jgi:HSP20 family molecular chaperone IbpA
LPADAALRASVAQFATRSLVFPANADLTNVKAHMDAGVLRVHVPKREETRQRQTIKVA